MARLFTNVSIDDTRSATEVEVAGTRMAVASSHDVLGLSADLRVREAAMAALRAHGPMVDPGAALVTRLEARLAEMLAVRRVRLTATCPAPQTLGGTVELHERLARRLGGASTFTGQALSAAVKPASVLLVDGTNPWEGDLAPLPRLLDECQASGVHLAVLDARGLGALGPQGGGVVEHLGLRGHVEFQLVALEGVGGTGWALAGDPPWVDAVAARHGHEALSAPSLAAALTGLEIAHAETQRRARLFDLTEHLLQFLRGAKLDTGPAVLPWVPVLVGDEALTEQWARAAAEASVVVHALLDGSRSRLLLALPATTSDAQFAALTSSLERTCRRVPLPTVSALAPTLVSRPGTYITGVPSSAAWGLQRAHIEERRSSTRRLFDVFETLTWRAANARRPSWPGMTSVRALIDRARRGR